MTALAVGYAKGEFSKTELYAKRNEAFEKAGLEVKYRSRIGFTRPVAASDAAQGTEQFGDGAVTHMKTRKREHVDGKKSKPRSAVAAAEDQIEDPSTSDSANEIEALASSPIDCPDAGSLRSEMRAASPLSS